MSNISDKILSKYTPIKTNYSCHGKTWNLRARAKRAIKINHNLGYYDLEHHICKYLNWINKKGVKNLRIKNKKWYNPY